jgi:Porphobilinogen deaminase, dipyromethane cofactor binding domain
MSSPYHHPLRVGTRGSPLAVAQARQVTGQLRERCGGAAILITMSTPGDGSAGPTADLGTTGVFTTTLRAVLLRGEVHLGSVVIRAQVTGAPAASSAAGWRTCCSSTAARPCSRYQGGTGPASGTAGTAATVHG